MKLAEQHNKLRTKGVQAKTQFKIEASAKAFEILSKSLYKDGIKAIIRELSTNAIDAHIDAGTLDTKYVVILPSTDNPKFSIRDFGTGMSPDKIESLYTTYFGSDKNNSNEFVGCLGLGSKSPFSYGNSFYVTSFYNGTAYYYVATIVNGSPEIHFHQKMGTDEPNGMLIGFAVKLPDVETFHDKAQSVYKYFKYRPEIKGADFTFTDPEKHLVGNGWHVCGEKSVAVMGNIGYPIDAEHFQNDSLSTSVHPNAPARYQRNGYGYGSEYQQLLGLGIHINFDIGDIEMTPSREDLQYTDQTVDAIKTRLDAIKQEIGDLLSEQFANAPNLYEARRLFTQFSNGAMGPVLKMVHLTSVKYKGVDLNKSISLREYYPTTVDHIVGTEVVALAKHAWRSRIYVDSRVESIILDKDKAPVFLEDDLVRGSHAAVRRLLDGNGTSSIAYLLKFDDAAAKQKFCDVLGFDESYIGKASLLPKPVRVPGSKATKERVFVLDTVKGSYHRDPKDVWKAENIIMEDGGVFVEINRYQFRWGKDGTLYRPYILTKMLDKFTALGIKLEPIVGVKTVVADKFRKCEDAEWLDLKDYLIKQLDAHVKNNKLEDVIANIQSIQVFKEAGFYIELYKNSNVSSKINTDFSNFMVTIHKLDKIRKAEQKNVENVLDLARELGYNVTSGQSVDLAAESEALKAKYPVLNLLDGYDVGQANKATIAINYINKEN